MSTIYVENKLKCDVIHVILL